MHIEGIFSVHVAMAIKVVHTGMRGCMEKTIIQHLISSPPNTGDTTARLVLDNPHVHNMN